MRVLFTDTKIGVLNSMLDAAVGAREVSPSLFRTDGEGIGPIFLHI